MAKYVNIKEAAKLLNVSDRTIRRRLDSLAKSLDKFVKRDKGQILIDVRLVHGNFKQIEQPATDVPETKIPSKELAKTLQVLNEQLREKDKQIGKLLDQLNESSERLKETNYTIANLQKERTELLLLIEPNHQPTTEQEPPQPPTPKKQPSILFFVLTLFLVIVLLLVMMLLEAI